MALIPKPIKERIRDAIVFSKSGIGYHDLLEEVFPEQLYPKSRRCGCNGGPPGCAMAFGRALREMNLSRFYTGIGRKGKITREDLKSVAVVK